MIFGKYINKYYLRYSPLLLLGIAALIVVDYLQLIVPEFYRMVINGMNGGNVVVGGSSVPFDMELVLDRICLPMIGVILAMVAGRFLWRLSFYNAEIRMENDLRGKMFGHCKELSQEYYQQNKVGDLMSLFTNDLETVQECFGDGVMMFCDALLLGVMAVYKMIVMDPVLTVLSMIPMLLLIAVGVILGRSMTRRWDARQQAFSQLSDFSQENYSGIAVIKAFVKELKELLAFRKLNRLNEETNVAYTKISALLHILVTLFVESVVCVILGYGGYLVYLGEFDAGQLVEYIGYFTAVVWPVMAVAMLIEKSSRGKASLSRISELLDAPITVHDRVDAEEVPEIKGRIEFRDLTFRYPDGEFDVLKNISFVIEAGENVGIAGKTGSGKSTLADLILRTYNVPDGTLFIDGRDVNSVTIRSLRNGCAYVPQDNFLFSDTISNNINFALDNADEEMTENAARLADVYDNIKEFGDGFSTVLGERGVTVSGGQKQRISIARALIKNAAVLILDDSVSAVDTSTEKVILDNLRKHRAGKTTILIAHRVSTVESLDKIIYLEEGEVRAVGTHAELYERCDGYRRMVELQRLESEAGGDGDE